MPTESQYRSAADEFRRRALAHRETIAWSSPRPSQRFVGDGPVADRIDRAVEMVLRRLGDAADQLDGAARECERRAAVCRAYHDDLRRYGALPWHIREHTVEPTRPARWVD